MPFSYKLSCHDFLSLTIIAFHTTSKAAWPGSKWLFSAPTIALVILSRSILDSLLKPYGHAAFTYAHKSVVGIQPRPWQQEGNSASSSGVSANIPTMAWALRVSLSFGHFTRSPNLPPG